MKDSYVRIFDVDVRDGAVQESAEDTRVAVPRRSTLDSTQLPVRADRLPCTDQLLHLFGPVQILFHLGPKVPLADFLRLCTVLLANLELLDKGSNDKADIAFFSLSTNDARSELAYLSLHRGGSARLPGTAPMPSCTAPSCPSPPLAAGPRPPRIPS